jgi:hypothetical protein
MYEDARPFRLINTLMAGSVYAGTVQRYGLCGGKFANRRSALVNE